MKNTKKYTIYFEIYGKKMKVNVMAESPAKAQNKVKDKIIFHKIKLDKKDYFNKTVDAFNGIMDVLYRKK